MIIKPMLPEEYLHAKTRVNESINYYNTLVKQGDAEETFIIDESVIWDRAEIAIESYSPVEALKSMYTVVMTLVEMEKANDDEKLHDINEYKSTALEYVANVIMKLS